MNRTTDGEIEQVIADERDPDREMIERARSYLICLDPEYGADLRRHEQEWSRHYRAVPNTDLDQVLVNFWRSGDEIWFDHHQIQGWCVPIVPGTDGPIPIPMVPLELSALFGHVLAVADLSYGRRQDALGGGLYVVDGNVRFTFLRYRGVRVYGIDAALSFARRLLSVDEPGDPEPPKPGADLPPQQDRERKAA